MNHHKWLFKKKDTGQFFSKDFTYNIILIWLKLQDLISGGNLCNFL